MGTGDSAAAERFCSLIVVLDTGLYTLATTHQNVHLGRLHKNYCKEKINNKVDLKKQGFRSVSGATEKWDLEVCGERLSS